MPSSSAFPMPDKAVVYSSDKISCKRDTTIYKELANNVEDYGSIAKNKKINNTNYQSNFFSKNCTGSVKLASAKNYDLLLSAMKGKRYNNPTLDGATCKAVASSQNGNHIRVIYDCSDNAPLKKLLYSDCGPTIGDPCLIGRSGPEIDDKEPWPREDNASAVPSYIIDPSYNLFYSSCQGNQLPWKNKRVCDVSFQEMPSYWRAANSQPLMGMAFSSNITFNTQLPQSFSASHPYPPRPRPINPADGAQELYDSWCKT